MRLSKVVLAYPWVDDKGKKHEPDSTVSVDGETAARLISDGRARRSDDNPKKEN